MSIANLWACALFTFTVFVSQISCYDDEMERTNRKRPVWNIGHMANNMAKVDEFLRKKANAIESDVTFDDSGNPVKVFHGNPCDCYRECNEEENIDTFVEHIRNLTTGGHPQYKPIFILMMWDLKLTQLSSDARKNAGTKFAQLLINKYWNRGNSGGRAYMIISVPSIQHKDFIAAFRKEFNDSGFTQFNNKTGYDFSGNENLLDILNVYNELNIQDNIWQSDGITNCLWRPSDRLLNALKIREFKASKPTIKKVYSWTYDLETSMTRALTYGVDALITNHPQKLSQILKTTKESTHRLARFSDKPWINISFQYPSGLNGEEKMELFDKNTRCIRLSEQFSQQSNQMQYQLANCSSINLE